MDGELPDREEILHELERCETLLQNIVQILHLVGLYDRVDSYVGGLSERQKKITDVIRRARWYG